MSRPLRIKYANAWYHVMNRGAGRRKIFKNSTYRAMFLKLLEECHTMFNIKIYAYCLMDNHYHLLLSTPDANLSCAMRHINGVYTQLYNRLSRTDGPLFRGRYHAKLIEDDYYLLIVNRYIHLNPVTAGLVHNAANYKWSSYSAYLGLVTMPNWLHADIILKKFSTIKRFSQLKNYQTYIETNESEEIDIILDSIGPIIGSETFKIDVLSQLNSSIVEACAPDIKRTKCIPTVKSISDYVCKYYAIDQKSLMHSKRGTLNWPKLVYMYISRKFFGHTLKTIAESSGYHCQASVSSAIQKCHYRIQNHSDLLNEIDTIYKTIKISSHNTQFYSTRSYLTLYSDPLFQQTIKNTFKRRRHCIFTL